MIGLALGDLAEPGRNRERGGTIGAVHAEPGAGDVGIAGGFGILLLFGPVIVLDGEPAGIFKGVRLVGALAIDREAVCGFDGESGA